jgi:hypothetical protein
MTRLMTALLVAAACLLTSCATGLSVAARDSAPVTVTETVTSTIVAPAGEHAPEGDPLPCDATHVAATIAPGERSRPGLWTTEIVVTNVGGPGACWLDGASELEFYSDEDGRPLGIKEVTSDDGAGELAVLELGDQASMSVTYPTARPGTRPECLGGGSFARVTMPGDSKTIEARPPYPITGLPPVCGAVRVTFWLSGGAPGVPS